MTVKILKLNRGVEIYRWLCESCTKQVEAEGWEVRGRKTPPHPLKCDDCQHDDAKPVAKPRAA